MAGPVFIMASRWKRLLLASGLIIAVFVGSAAIIRPIHAATDCGDPDAGFLCPDNSAGLNSKWDVLKLELTDQNNNTLNANTISAGTEVTAKVTYHVHQATSDNVDLWINIDGASSVFGSGGGFTDLGGGASNIITFGSPAQQQENCPSWYFAQGTHYYSNSDGDTPPNWNFVTGNNDGGWAGYPYGINGPYASNSTDDPHFNKPGHMTCGLEGRAAIWNSPNRTAGDHSYTMKFRINPKATNQSICMRAFMSKGNQASLYARSGEQSCLYVKPIKISGNVNSDKVNATGKPLGDVAVSFTRAQPGSACNWSDPNQTGSTTTNSSGYYEFTSSQNQQYCIRMASANVSYQGTDYFDPKTTADTTKSEYTDLCGNTDCNGKNFIYQPVPRAPVIDKDAGGFGTIIDSSGIVVDAPDPQVLRPGDRIAFEITFSNNIDANQNMDLKDYIPLNIDPASVSQSNIELEGTGDGPSTWYIDSPDPLSNPQPIEYGNTDPAVNTTYFANYSSLWSSGGGSTPPQLNWVLHRMPAYSQIVISFEGRVKSNSSSIGIYPSDTSYCAAGVNSANYSNTGKLAECEDKTNGLQGITNYAMGTTEGVFAPSISNITYNPIPGKACAVKTGAINPYTPDGQDSKCGVAYDKTIQYSTNPAIDEFNKITVNISVKQEGGMGPLPDMYVRDQNSSGINAAFGSPAVSGGTFDNATRVVNWSAPGGGSGDYSFVANMVDSGVPLGGRFSNVASACWPEYWTVGHPVHCDNTNQVDFIRVNVDYPYFSSEKGSVHVDSKGTNCGDIDSSSFGLRDNPGGRGWYVVSVSGGNLSNFNSISGYNRADSLQQCRSDLTAVLNNMIANNPSLAVGNLQNGKIWKINAGGSPYNLGATNVGTRSTIFVNGDIYISGNVTYANGQTLDNTGSLGVVATGNIYIDPNVTELSGAYYAKGTINTCWTPASNGPKYQTGNVQSNPGGLSVGQCSQPLRVNGMLMANKFRFNRTQAAGAGPSEVSAFTDRLFLATPPGFSSANSLFNPNTYSGERRPRY